MIQWDYDEPLAPATSEPSKANQALHDYTLLGVDRSLAKLVAVYQKQTKPRPPTRTLSTLKEWSTTYSWVARPAKWSFQTAAIMADVAAKLAALSVGEPTERTAHQFVDGLTKKDLEQMSLDQLLALRAQFDGSKR